MADGLVTLRKELNEAYGCLSRTLGYSSSAARMIWHIVERVDAMLAVQPRQAPVPSAPKLKNAVRDELSLNMKEQRLAFQVIDWVLDQLKTCEISDTEAESKPLKCDSSSSSRLAGEPLGLPGGGHSPAPDFQAAFEAIEAIWPLEAEVTREIIRACARAWGLLPDSESGNTDIQDTRHPQSGIQISDCSFGTDECRAAFDRWYEDACRDVDFLEDIDGFSAWMGWLIAWDKGNHQPGSLSPALLTEQQLTKSAENVSYGQPVDSSNAIDARFCKAYSDALSCSGASAEPIELMHDAFADLLRLHRATERESSEAIEALYDIRRMAELAVPLPGKHAFTLEHIRMLADHKIQFHERQEHSKGDADER